MKHKLTYVVIIGLLLITFTGCKPKQGDLRYNEEEGQLQIYQYDNWRCANNLLDKNISSIVTKEVRIATCEHEWEFVGVGRFYTGLLLSTNKCVHLSTDFKFRCVQCGKEEIRSWSDLNDEQQNALQSLGLKGELK